MFFSYALIAVFAPLLVSAAPTRLTRRAEADVLVFKFADVLEQLESQFYKEGIAKFTAADFSAAGFTSPQAVAQQLQGIQDTESTHSVVLQAALKSFGAEPITSCKFDFSSALTDVTTMAATARVVENVGVSAYLGASTLLTDPVLLTAAASILTVEARHQTMLNALAGATPIPSAFDIPMTPSEILALAGPFISGCDTGIPANTPLTITNTGKATIGTQLTFSAPTINGTIAEDKLHCQMMLGGAPHSIALPMSQCIVPEGVNGPVAIWITSDAQPLVNNVRDRATAQLVAGPTYAFVDTQADSVGQLLRTTPGSATGAAAASLTTQTISPDAASSVIANAAAPTGAASSSAPAAAPTGAAAPVNAAATGPNEFKGTTKGERPIEVLGWL